MSPLADPVVELFACIKFDCFPHDVFDWLPRLSEDQREDENDRHTDDTKRENDHAVESARLDACLSFELLY